MNRHIIALMCILGLALYPALGFADDNVEFKVMDDLTVLGTSGDAADADVEIKGYTELEGSLDLNLDAAGEVFTLDKAVTAGVDYDVNEFVLTREVDGVSTYALSGDLLRIWDKSINATANTANLLNLGTGTPTFSSVFTVDLTGDLTAGDKTTFNTVEYTWPGTITGKDNYALTIDESTGQLSWTDVGAGAVGGSGTSPQVTFWSGTSTLSSHADFTWVTADGLSIKSQKELRLHDSDNTNYTGFKAPLGASLASDIIYTLPESVGGTDRVLTVQTGDALEWKEVTGVGGAGDITDVGDVGSGAAFTSGGSGTSLHFHNSGHTGELTVGTLGANRTYTLPNRTGTVIVDALTPLNSTAVPGQVSIPQAAAGQDGFLDSADWSTFNGKQDTITWGDGLTCPASEASVDYDTTSLKMTSNKLDTIQSIATTATPEFAELGLTGVNPANGSADALALSGTLGIMDGADTFRGVYLNYANAAHTGADNFVYGLDINTITTPGSATEYALRVGSGWDGQIALLEAGATPTFYTTFKADDQTAPINYTLPDSLPGSGNRVLITDTTGDLSWGMATGAGGAPNDAKYILQEADTDLTNAQVLGVLATGMLKNTTTTGVGVLTIAVEGTDYYAPGGTTDVAVGDGGTGKSSWTQYGVIYADTTTSLSQLGAGTTAQVLHGNASGAPSWGAVDLANDVSGVLPAVNGGTGQDSSGWSELVKVTGGTWSTATAGTDYVTADSSNTFTNKTFDANGAGNTISNLETADFAANVVDNDTTLSNDSATRLPTQHAAKVYIDNSIAGLKWKQSVRAATTADGTLATAYENADVIDGVTLATGDRILIKEQTTGSENGIYTVNATGAPTRATDADTSSEIKQSAVFAEEGTSFADTAWVCSDDVITLGTTSLTFVQFAGGALYSAGTGLTLTGNEFSITPLTANRAVVTDGSGHRTASAVTSTEVGYLSGVGSAIQTQLNAKEGTISAGTNAQYWRGDKTWQTLNQAAVAGLTTGDSPSFTGLTLSGMTTAGIVKNTVAGLLSGGNSVVLTTDVTGTLPVGNGGTGSGSTPTNGQLLIGNGTDYTLATLTQNSANQVVIANAAGSITLSTPQDINTTSTVQFAKLGLGAAAGTHALNATGTVNITGNVTVNSGDLAIDSGRKVILDGAGAGTYATHSTPGGNHQVDFYINSKLVACLAEK